MRLFVGMGGTILAARLALDVRVSSESTSYCARIPFPGEGGLGASERSFRTNTFFFWRNVVKVAFITKR